MTEPARRGRSRRVAIASVVALVVAGGLTAIVNAGGSAKSRRVRVASEAPSTSGATTSTWEDTTTSVPIPTITGATAELPTAATTAVPVVPVQPSDLVGTITLSTATIRIGDPAPLTLTLRNVSDRSVSIVDLDYGNHRLVIQADTPGFPGHTWWVATFDEQIPTLRSGESHAFASTIGLDSSDNFMVGATRAYAHLESQAGVFPNTKYPDDLLLGVAPVPFTVVPPGWTSGMPLDPTQANWHAEMSTDTPEVPEDGSVIVHTRIRNLSNTAATTRGFGALAFVCGPLTDSLSTFIDHVVEPVTVAPGAERAFSFTFSIPDVQAHGAATASRLKRIGCSVGVKFDELDDPFNFWAVARPGIDAPPVTITVLHPGASTTTTTTTSPPTAAPST